MYGEIFIKKNKEQNLNQFVDFLQNILNIKDFIKRESSYYINEEYYMATMFGFELKVYIADDSRFKDYDYCIFIDLKELSIDKDNFNKIFTQLISKQLLKNKYNVIIPKTAFKR